jgi:hypothetical protein
MFEDLKKYFFERKLKKDVKMNQSKRLLMNLKDSKNVGIAFDATDFSTITAVRDLELKLKQEGKSVSIYGYINSNDKKYEPFLITNYNLNWYGYPEKQQLFEFCRNEFDILFGFFYDMNSPLNAIFANSKSKLRIGANFNQSESLFDVIISSSKIKSSIDTITYLTDFLTKVKTK